MKMTTIIRVLLGIVVLNLVFLNLLLFSAETPKHVLLVLSKPGAKLLIVDVDSKKVIGEVPVGTAPHEVAVSADGNFAFVANYGDQTPGSTLSVIDLATRKEVRRKNLGVLRRPHGIVESHGKIYFTAEINKVVVRYDPATDSIDWLQGTGQNVTHMLVITVDERKIFTANIGSDSVSVITTTGNGQNWRVAQIAVGKRPEGIGPGPDGMAWVK
jgi:YVTN family beta-propeller protein